jgi:hypothetical protein
MQNERFVVLTGHLSNYPLSDLVGILRHQRKSGRLLIEYAKGPATFFFQNGELIDARLNELTGLQAICVALAQPEASFNFNPLIQSSRRSIEASLQRAVAELFGCWDESFAQIEIAAAQQPEPLALPPAPPVIVRKRSLFLIAAAIAIAIALSIVIALIGGLNNNAAAETAVQASQTPVAAQPEVAKAPVATVVKPNRVERKEERDCSSHRSATGEGAGAVVPVDQGRDADRERARVESLDRESKAGHGQLRSARPAHRAPAPFSGDYKWWTDSNDQCWFQIMFLTQRRKDAKKKSF